ncbi:MAG: DUF962 domain-containing protein [Phycisphaerae bacterium]|nr:DUF962 domain-containing protein [Phycisphaerae bacterium]
MIPSLVAKAYRNWRSRHRHPVSFALHLVGIPACFLAAPVLLIVREFLAAGGCFLAGYALQFLGHFVEGNRPGEELILRRLLRRR